MLIIHFVAAGAAGPHRQRPLAAPQAQSAPSLQLLLLLLLVVSLGSSRSSLRDASASGNLVVRSGRLGLHADHRRSGRRESASIWQGSKRARWLSEHGKRQPHDNHTRPDPWLRLLPPHRVIKAPARCLEGLAASNRQEGYGLALTLASASARHIGDATCPHLRRRAGGSKAHYPQVSATARYIDVGNSAANVGITSLSLRDAPRWASASSPACTTSGITSPSALLSVSVDGQLRNSRSLQLGPNDEQTVALQGLPPDTKQAEARLTTAQSGADCLPPTILPGLCAPSAPRRTYSS